MKILKIFGIVVGIHVFALILIFANPGCSASSAKSREAAAPPASSATVSLPPLDYGSSTGSPVTAAPLNGPDASPITAAPILFNPDAPATSAGTRFSPTRPGTPAAGVLQAPPVADVLPVSTYTVVRGDSLWSLAKKNGLTVAELAAANRPRPTPPLCNSARKLVIPAKSAVPAPSPAPASAEVVEPKPAAEAVVHVVKAGETLGAIARKYQVTVGEIATANNITDPGKIRPGRELVIPGWKAPGARPAAEAPATTRPVQAAPAAPTIRLPAPDEDLDAGLKPKSDVPVIKIDEPSPFQSS
ncbi:MAG: LysM peptidoglycan-binding domain-containing protein [Opitutaceae bacterium]|nr:LysM peptidoglycan-binding domain-containing protein [Opitutaceae bacterium]